LRRVAFVLLPVPALAGSSPVVLNEVLYDPDGADAGREFVELGAALGGDADASLAGWVLETGNGARPGEWTVAWVGGAADRLRGGLFVVGESGVEPRPDAVADLDLQNGPDACRLRGPAGEEDRVGWGEPLDASFREGAPADDVSGLALARLPDGLDTGDNSRDFRPVAPSPGDFNAPELALVVEEFAAPPASPVFAWTVRNVGRTAAPARVQALCTVHPDEVLAEADGGMLAPGAGTHVEAAATPPPGTHLPVADPPGGAAPAAWRGPGGDVVVSEALSRPREDGTEWVELLSVASQRVDLAAFGLADAAGSVAALRGTVPSGGWAVVAADTSALRRDWSVPATAVVVRGVPWPALNHTAPAGEAAERIVLRVGDAETVAAALPGGASEGVAFEIASRWRDPGDPASWAPSLDPSGGTPGRANSRDGDRGVPETAARLVVHPSPFRPDRDGAVVLVFRAPAARTCRMTVHDSAGRTVATLAPWATDGGEHRALWDGRLDGGRSAVLGLYLVRAEAPGERPVAAPVVLVR